MKANETIIPVIAALGLVILLTISFGAYQFGMQRGKDQSNVAKEQAYAQNLNDRRQELNQITNEHQSACYNYQALYTKYEELYRKVGADSGLAKMPRPDGARGNEESCYR